MYNSGDDTAGPHEEDNMRSTMVEHDFKKRFSSEAKDSSDSIRCGNWISRSSSSSSGLNSNEDLYESVTDLDRVGTTELNDYVSGNLSDSESFHSAEDLPTMLAINHGDVYATSGNNDAGMVPQYSDVNKTHDNNRMIDSEHIHSHSNSNNHLTNDIIKTADSSFQDTFAQNSSRHNATSHIIGGNGECLQHSDSFRPVPPQRQTWRNFKRNSKYDSGFRSDEDTKQSVTRQQSDADIHHSLHQLDMTKSISASTDFDRRKSRSLGRDTRKRSRYKSPRRFRSKPQETHDTNENVNTQTNHSELFNQRKSPTHDPNQTDNSCHQSSSNLNKKINVQSGELQVKKIADLSPFEINHQKSHLDDIPVNDRVRSAFQSPRSFHRINQVDNQNKTLLQHSPQLQTNRQSRSSNTNFTKKPRYKSPRRFRKKDSEQSTNNIHDGRSFEPINHQCQSNLPPNVIHPIAIQPLIQQCAFNAFDILRSSVNMKPTYDHFYRVANKPDVRNEQKQTDDNGHSSVALCETPEVQSCFEHTDDIKMIDKDNESLTFTPTTNFNDIKVDDDFASNSSCATDVYKKDNDSVHSTVDVLPNGKDAQNDIRQAQNNSLNKGGFLKRFRQRPRQSQREVCQQNRTDETVNEVSSSALIDETDSSYFDTFESESIICSTDEIQPTDKLQVTFDKDTYDKIHRDSRDMDDEYAVPPCAYRRRDSKYWRLEQKRQELICCCKKIATFMLSHIGLVSLVVAYCVMGGLLFQWLEQDANLEQHKRIIQVRNDTINEIYLLAHRIHKYGDRMNMTTFVDKVEEHLKRFQFIVYNATKYQGWNGNEDQGGDSTNFDGRWTLSSSLLFAITVMTTIGYGHVAPKTIPGQLVTIAYAIFGIPITLLCLTNIGDLMAHGFRLLYGKICCGVFCRLISRKKNPPDVEKGEVTVTLGQEIDKPTQVIQVPTSLCLMLIAFYILAGGKMFAHLEEWDTLDGAYFCFITLSTIGFGDIVPGTKSLGDNASKLVLCAVYLIVGLSLIAMCFTLVQEDVKAKCRWIGQKIGILEKEQL